MKCEHTARFFLFFLYQFDIHNLAIEGLDSKIADLREEFRWDNIEIKNPDLDLESKVDELTSGMESLELNRIVYCKHCGAGYSKEGYLKRHIESKHGIVAERDMTGPLCGECEKVFRKCKNFRKAYENTFEV